MSWNGFPRRLTSKLINQFNPSTSVCNDVDNEATITETNTIDDTKIWLQLPYLGKFGNRLTRSFIRKITPLLTLKCRFIINWKTINSNVFVSCKNKTPTPYQSSAVYEFICPGCNSRYIGKTDRCLYTRTKEHSHQKTSEIHQHFSSCEQFQHIKAILELYPDDDAMSNKPCIMAEHVFHNTKIIDKSNHWSLLLYQESLAIQRHKPELNHGIKASKELTIFN